MKSDPPFNGAQLSSTAGRYMNNATSVGDITAIDGGSL